MTRATNERDARDSQFPPVSLLTHVFWAAYLDAQTPSDETDVNDRDKRVAR